MTNEIPRGSLVLPHFPCHASPSYRCPVKVQEAARRVLPSRGIDPLHDPFDPNLHRRGSQANTRRNGCVVAQL